MKDIIMVEITPRATNAPASTRSVQVRIDLTKSSSRTLGPQLSDSSDAFTAKKSNNVRVVVRQSQLPDRAAYTHLRGYFTVRRVLKRVRDSPGIRYRILRNSEEENEVSLEELLSLTNGRSALQTFENMEARSSRLRRQAAPYTNLGFSSDSNESDEEAVNIRRRRPILQPNESETDELAWTSDQAPSPASRSSPSIPSRRRRVISSDEESSDISERRAKKRKRRSNPPLRRSERAQAIPRKNLKEFLEDEIDEVSEGSPRPAQNRAASTKEIFSRATHNKFRDQHLQICMVCFKRNEDKTRGPLVFCQGCTFAYHRDCLGYRASRDHLVTKVNDGQFVLQCRHCIGHVHAKDRKAPHLGICSVCEDLGNVSVPFREKLTSQQEQALREEHGGDPVTTVDPLLLNSPENLLFRCTRCRRAWHFDHLPTQKEAIDSDLYDEDDENEDPDPISSTSRPRLKGHRLTNKCFECSNSPEQLNLVAWRPLYPDAFIPGSTINELEEIEKEYLVKWKEKSHFHDTWMPGAWVWAIAPQVRIPFSRKIENQRPKLSFTEAVPEEWLRIDIVFDVEYHEPTGQSSGENVARAENVTQAFVKYKGLDYEDSVWEKPPKQDDVERWADFKAAYQEWALADVVYPPNKKTLDNHLRTIRGQPFGTLLKTTQPSTLVGGEMMQYQLDGLNWLLYQWYKEKSCILADEMGLGKTIQAISFLTSMVQDHKCWPWLIIVPNSTCANWRREIKKWAPSIRSVSYFGSSTAREMASKYELFPESRDYLQAHVVISSYETVTTKDAWRVLSRISWQGLFVDEGQRLKNDHSLFYESISQLEFPFKVLLTGTPLQNNARELFNLLHFLDNGIDAARFEEDYADLDREKVSALHEFIRPFFLRRTKAEVLKFLPPVAQVILPVTMTSMQKKIYKVILAKNPQLMKSIFSRPQGIANPNGQTHSLNNLLMQLRKVLCHPFVYSESIEERLEDYEVSHRNLIDASPKLKLFEIMLPKLKERGHRVLMFSQFLANLDLIEDFLDGLGLEHRRLDGRMSSSLKQKHIDEFNAPNSKIFAFLLSTRAGGVGINLATADTVIIMDPDFNPHQDIQALSRAHRIGQQNKVLVFRMMTRSSVEEKILQVGKRKMALDHVLIQQMGADEDTTLDLESILKHGAAQLFDENAADDDIIYDSASVDALLDRSQIERPQTGDEKSKESQFSFAKVWVNDKSSLEDTIENADAELSTPLNSNIWDRIMQEREKAFEEEQRAREEALGRGKRRRQTVDYTIRSLEQARSISTNDLTTIIKDEVQDDDFELSPSESEGDKESDPEKGRKRSRSRVGLENSQKRKSSQSRSQSQSSVPRSGTPRSTAGKKTPAQNVLNTIKKTKSRSSTPASKRKSTSKAATPSTPVPMGPLTLLTQSFSPSAQSQQPPPPPTLPLPSTSTGELT